MAVKDDKSINAGKGKEIDWATLICVEEKFKFYESVLEIVDAGFKKRKLMLTDYALYNLRDLCPETIKLDTPTRSYKRHMQTLSAAVKRNLVQHQGTDVVIDLANARKKRFLKRKIDLAQIDSITQGALCTNLLQCKNYEHKPRFEFTIHIANGDDLRFVSKRTERDEIVKNIHHRIQHFWSTFARVNKAFKTLHPSVRIMISRATNFQLQLPVCVDDKKDDVDASEEKEQEQNAKFKHHINDGVQDEEHQLKASNEQITPKQSSGIDTKLQRQNPLKVNKRRKMKQSTRVQAMQTHIALNEKFHLLNQEKQKPLSIHRRPQDDLSDDEKTEKD